jgi:putative methyltransferase (TIGR04325 family)
MNDALDLYSGDVQVACIHGFNYPIEGMPKTFFLKGADCWGWGTWKRAWNFFEKDGTKLLKELERRNCIEEFDFNGAYIFSKMLRQQIENNNNSWAIRWYASAFLNDMLCLYPGITFVKNIGLDGTGVHCEATKEMIQEISNTWYGKLFKIPVAETSSCRKMFEQYLKGRKKKGLCFFRKAKNGNYRLITLFNCIRFSYRKKGRRTGKYGFFGDYESFEEVQKLATGYQSDNILQTTLASISKVKSGEAAFERDSCLFDKVQYSFPLLAALQKIGIEYGKLNVLDFGGSLGSHYFQNRAFLQPLPIEKWTVVEQSHYVKAGREQIADGVLDFAYSIDEVISPNVMIVSGVLPYLDLPYQWLDKLMAKKVPYIIFDRTGFNVKPRDRLTLQRVPPLIYEASYPAWFLNKERFIDQVEKYYEIMLEWDGTDVVNVPSKYLGFLLKWKGVDVR